MICCSESRSLVTAADGPLNPMPAWGETTIESPTAVKLSETERTIPLPRIPIDEIERTPMIIPMIASRERNQLILRFLTAKSTNIMRSSRPRSGSSGGRILRPSRRALP